MCLPTSLQQARAGAGGSGKPWAGLSRGAQQCTTERLYDGGTEGKLIWPGELDVGSIVKAE